jgi:hypothetical protein
MCGLVGGSRIDAVNGQIIKIISDSHIWWVEVGIAQEVIPTLKPYTLLHAGPPLQSAEISGAMKNAIYGAIVYEKWARNLEEAKKFFDESHVTLYSAHDHAALGPMAGIISPSMPVLIMKNEPFGNHSFVTLNEGLGNTLRFGANSQEVLDRLVWIERTLAIMLQETIDLGGPIDITEIMARAVQRGDECHNRNKAATSLLFRRIAPWMVKTSFSKQEIGDVLAFIDSNDHFFLNYSMAATKATMDQVNTISGGSIVSCMASNGVQFGIKVAGCGNRWFTAPAPIPDGKYFDGFEEKDANPVMGDSYISETAGLGGVALAAAPGIIRFIGGSVQEAVQSTLEMYEITVAEHPLYKIPSLGFRGTPLGIDVRLVCKNGILPFINTGIAHKEPGVGQIGAGRFRAPKACFLSAAEFAGPD